MKQKLHLKVKDDIHEYRSPKTICETSPSGKKWYHITEHSTLVNCKKCIKKIRESQNEKR